MLIILLDDMLGALMWMRGYCVDTWADTHLLSVNVLVEGKGHLSQILWQPFLCWCPHRITTTNNCHQCLLTRRHRRLVYKDLMWTDSLSCLLLPICCSTLLQTYFQTLLSVCIRMSAFVIPTVLLSCPLATSHQCGCTRKVTCCQVLYTTVSLGPCRRQCIIQNVALVE